MLSRRHLLIAAPALAAPVFAAPAFAGSPALRLATFEADVTPPIGSPLCVSLVPDAARIESRLSARGVVLYPSGQQPIVLCAVDWLGIGNGAMSAWKLALARVVRTQPSRVAVHTVHQHDAPGQDDSAYALLKQRGRTHLLQPAAFASIAVQRTAAAAGLAKPQTISHFATGEAAVSDIASNRRILSPDGKAFLFQRFTACRNSAYCDAPVGTIDPNLKTVSFYNGPLRIASLHYYATHPMSYYGKGVVNADFVGIARSAVQSAAAGFPVYFTGAAGNIGAGKYNDGDPANRARLAGRLADAMQRALASERVRPVSQIQWLSRQVLLPHREGADFSEAAILKALNDPAGLSKDIANSARYLAWWQRCRARQATDISCLHFEGAAILHLPGELFVEYQLAAQKMSPVNVVAMAAYGDYGPMYIPTAAAYAEGGYESSQVSRVSPAAEDLLLSTIQALVLRNESKI